ncbi:MAG: LppX_LprAFG lipoprotein, partial [Chloroflexota bacterium]
GRVLFAALLLVACAGPAAPSPQALLERAAQDALDLVTVRFSLLREGAPVMLDPLTNTRFSEASGAYQAPDRVRARVKAQVAAVVLGLEMIWLPDAVYASNPLTGAFAKLPARPAFAAASLFGRDGVPGLLKSGLRDVKLVGRENLYGVDAHHLRGSADGEALKALTGGAVVAGAHTLDVWIEVATSHILRLDAREPDGISGWRLELSEFNKTVEITAP